MVRIQGQTALELMARMRPYRKKLRTMAIQVPFDFEIVVNSNQIDGVVKAPAGSWLAYTERDDNDVRLYPITAEEFARTYGPDDD